MAKIYGKRSEYSKKMAEVVRIFEGVYIFTAGAFTYAIISNIVRSVNEISIASVLAIIFLILIYTPVYIYMYRVVKKFRIDEKKYIKGDKGEGRAYYELLKLPREFSIVQSVVLSERGDIDFVVLGKHKIFTVEVKSHSGTIGFDGERLVRDGELFEKEILGQARSQAFSVANHILKSTNEEIWVDPVVVFTGSAKIHFGKRKIGGVYVIGINWLNDLLQEKDVGESFITDEMRGLLDPTARTVLAVAV